MCDRALSGDQSATVVTKVPGEADLRVVQVLAGIVDVDGKADSLVLDEVPVVLVYIIHLGKRYGERNLV